MCVLAIMKALYEDKLLSSLKTFSDSQLVVASDHLFLFFDLSHLSAPHLQRKEEWKCAMIINFVEDIIGYSLFH